VGIGWPDLFAAGWNGIEAAIAEKPLSRERTDWLQLVITAQYSGNNNNNNVHMRESNSHCHQIPKAPDLVCLQA